MKIYSQSLDQESISSLEYFVSCDIQSLLFSSADMDYGSNLLQVTNISIPIGPKKYLIIDNDWCDTPKEYHDYYFLEVRISNEPNGIGFRDNGKKHYTLVNVPFLLHLGPRKSVEKVTVLTYSHAGEEESVEYDAGLLIELSGGVKVAVVRVESISGFLYVAHTAPDIARLTRGLNQRSVINA